MIDYKRSVRDSLGALGQRAKRLRLARKLRQEALADRAGVGVATVRRFESSGRASIENVLRIATALSVERAFEQLFEAPAFATLDEALALPAAPQRRRAPRSPRKK